MPYLTQPHLIGPHLAPPRMNVIIHCIIEKAEEKMHPKVDIIVLVHNHWATTQGFIKHVFANTENFRLIFIDNGSTDETSEQLELGQRQGKWEVVSPGENLGVIGGRNLGAKHIESDFFLNIDNDQYPKKGWMDGLFDLLDEGYDIVGSEAWALLPPKSPGTIVVNNITIPDRSYFPHKHCSNPMDRFTYIGCGGMLIKTEIYEKIGLFDEIFSPAYFEDPDFCFRSIQSGFKLGWKHDCPINHLSHQTFNDQNLFDKNSQFVKSWMAFREKWFPYFPKPIQMEIRT